MFPNLSNTIPWYNRGNLPMLLPVQFTDVELEALDQALTEFLNSEDEESLVVSIYDAEPLTPRTEEPTGLRVVRVGTYNEKVLQRLLCDVRLAGHLAYVLGYEVIMTPRIDAGSAMLYPEYLIEKRELRGY